VPRYILVTAAGRQRHPNVDYWWVIRESAICFCANQLLVGVRPCNKGAALWRRRQKRKRKRRRRSSFRIGINLALMPIGLETLVRTFAAGNIQPLFIWTGVRGPARQFLTRNVTSSRYIAALRKVYSITSSAVASSAGGMVTPSVLAVLRLITSSNLVGF
jgi:hypothetical protein